MRHLRASVVLALVAGMLPISTPAQAHVPVVFTGHGWGHAVGLPQYGAKTLAALDDCPSEVTNSPGRCTGEQIVEYYYTDAEVTDMSSLLPDWLLSDPEPIWVNLTGYRHNTLQTVSFKSTGAGLVFCQQEPDWLGSLTLAKNGGEYSPYVELLQGKLIELGYDPGPADGWFGALTESAVMAFQTDEGLGADGEVGSQTKNALWEYESGDRCVIETPLGSTALKLTPNAEGTQCTLTGALPGSCFGSVRDLSEAARLVIPERKVRDGTPIELAHGNVRVRPDMDSGSGAFEGIHVVLEVGIDDYIRGIDEIIYGWATVANESLRAQAIASRSYGTGNAKTYGPEVGFSNSRKDWCWCHLWSNTDAQVYAGYYAETRTGGVWDDAVDSTLGMVLEHPTAGLVIAYFSSSSGGATQNNEDVWGPTVVPYLRSVPDPWSIDTEGPYPNPFANWSFEFNDSTVAAKVGLDTLLGVEVSERYVSGYVKTVRFIGMDGGSKVSVYKSGPWVKSTFGLRSSLFEVAWGEGGGVPLPPPEDPVFDDIAGHVFENAIIWLAGEKITLGCNPPENNLFCPDQQVTRGQMAVFISRALSLPEALEDHFTDDTGKFWEGAANRVYEAGIAPGCAPGLFCGADLLPREQMALFMSNALGLPATAVDYFVDDETSPYEDYINRIAEAGITFGCNPPDNDRFCPDGFVTRGQMAAFFLRAWGP